MHYQIIQVVTEDQYRRYYHLRWQLLRAPWKQPEGSETDDIEAQCLHLMAIDDNDECIGVARLQLNSITQAQIRYMAVTTACERKGIGRALIAALEKHAGQAGIKTIVLDARETAVGFYEKLGYRVIEKSYRLFGEIQHFRMHKELP